MHGKHAADVCPLGMYWLLTTCVPIVNQECNPVAPNTEMSLALPFEPPHEKTNNVHRRKQRRRSASR